MVALVEKDEVHGESAIPIPTKASPSAFLDRPNSTVTSTGLAGRAGIGALIDESRRALSPAQQILQQSIIVPLVVPLVSESAVAPSPTAASAEVLACKVGNAIVVGIDGTGSPTHRKETGGANPLFVEQIVKQYKTDPKDKFYHDGPDSGGVLKYLPSTFGEDAQIEESAFRFVKDQHSLCPEQPIDMYGYSRGGYIVMQLAHRLEKEGIPIRHMGLLDPVDSDLGYGDKDGIPKNVKSAAVVVAEESEYNVDCEPTAVTVRTGCIITPTYIQSRSYFNRRPTDVEASSTKYERLVTRGTHAAIGGGPGTGDHPLGYTVEGDKAAAKQSKKFLFESAFSAGASFLDSDDK